jgi:hypothetical protein
LPRFAVVEGYEEHAFIPYTNIFATAEDEAGKTKAGGEQKEPGQSKSGSDHDEGGKATGDKKQETVSLQDNGPDHHPDQKLEDLPKEPRAEYIQSTVTRITTREVSFVRHHHHPRHHRIQTRAQEKATDKEEAGGTRKLGKRNGKKGQTNPIWKLETGTGIGSTSSDQSSTAPTGPHIHLKIDGEPDETQKVDLLTPPPSKGNTPMQDRGFTCCNDCISPSSGCCQASSVSPSTPHVHATTDSAGGQGQVGEGGLLTPQPSVEFKIDLNGKDSQQVPVTARGKTMRARGCATCLSNSETCCQATSTFSSSSSSPSSSLTTDPNGIEPVAGGMQPPLPSLVKGAIEDEQEQAHVNNSNNTAEEDEVDVTETIRFKYLIYATGSRLPHPLIRLPKKKMEAKDWLKENQRAVREATRVLVVGGGALGIRESQFSCRLLALANLRLNSGSLYNLVEFASDIKAYFPTHHVILINSRSRFLSIYEPEMHDHIQADLEALGVEVMHNERVEDLDDLERQRDDAARQEGREGKVGRRMVKTRLKSGAVIESDLQVRSNDFRIGVLLDAQIALVLAQTADHLYRTET